MVQLPIGALGHGPSLPAVGLVDDVAVGFAVQLCFQRLVGLQCVQVLQEQQPRGLLGVVQLTVTACVLVQDVVDILEGLFEHGSPSLSLYCLLFGIKRLVSRQRHQNGLQLAIERGPVLPLGFALVVAFEG